MSNKRLTDLVELSAASVKTDDLFLVGDTGPSVLESKKIKAVSIKTYVLDNGSITGSITYAQTANTASYIDPSNIGLIDSASYSITASYIISASYSINSLSSSYINGANVGGIVPSSSYNQTASYLNYVYNNGRIENAQTASYCGNALTSSFILYTPGVYNGTASYALTAGTSVFDGSASYLNYTGGNTGTASYALTINVENTASYLVLPVGRENGTASFSMTSSHALQSANANFLYYHVSLNPNNGTASYAIKSSTTDVTQTASYVNRIAGTDNGVIYRSIISDTTSASLFSYSATSASYASTASIVISSSYALTSSYLSNGVNNSDSNFYRIYGPYVATAHAATESYVQYFVVNNASGAGRNVIVEAIGDVKVPVTNTETNSYIYLYVSWVEPGGEWDVEVDKSRAGNYITGSGMTSLTGNSKQSFMLKGNYSLSGSWYQFKIITDGGVTLDDKVVKFTLYSNADTITKLSSPPA